MQSALSAQDIEPCANETADRIATGLVTLVPFLALGVVVWQAWESLLHWHDFVVFGVIYVLPGLGITVGFHRYFTHRAFKTNRVTRGTLAILGTAAIEGPITAWVADHRKHHAFSDQVGDPHSPHVDHGKGLRGALRGLAHALGGTLTAALTGLLWGGAVRILLLHHVTFSINSLCHFFGRKRFETGDESRNLLWLAPLTFGEAWHNNHHAFPTSAAHGMRWYERMLDPSALVIGGLERLGLVWDVVKISEERQATKLVAAYPRTVGGGRPPPAPPVPVLA